MLSTKQPSLMWAWVCPVTGMVWQEGMGNTEPYAKQETERTWGKKRMAMGEMLLCRVTVEPLTAEETEKHRAEFAEWRAAKVAEKLTHNVEVRGGAKPSNLTAMLGG